MIILKKFIFLINYEIFKINFISQIFIYKKIIYTNIKLSERVILIECYLNSFVI